MLLPFIVAFQLSAQAPSAADRAFAAAEWATAAREYLSATQKDSTDIRAHFRLGVSLFELGRFQEAIPLFERAVAARFQVNMAEFRQARTYARLGMPSKALDHLERAATAGVGFELVTTQSDLAAIRTEARYVVLARKLEDARFPCRNSPATHQFDFWIGDWVVTPWADPSSSPRLLGRNKVSAQLEQCLILEEWIPTGGGSGKSFNFWDTNRKKWRQIWTAEDGESLDYEGVFRNAAMRFTGWTLNAKGRRILQKLTFFRIAPDTVRQLFEASEDNGKTWRSTFDGRYVRARQADSTGREHTT